MKEITEELIAETAVRLNRKEDCHKGDAGRIMFYAGSEGMTGAAVLCARSALRSGAGLVYCYVPAAIMPILQISVTEAICLRRGGEADLNSMDAIAAGPGLDAGPESREVCRLQGLLERYKGTLVLDAGALSMIAAEHMDDAVRSSKADIIITPHAGEAARLLGKDSISASHDGRTAAAAELAQRFSATAVLKGHGTLVACQDGTMLVNTTGNPGMATAGTGDVLTGMITALAGQGLTAAEAAMTGVYVHGLAGDIAAERAGQISMTAGDVVGCLPQAFKSAVRQCR